MIYLIGEGNSQVLAASQSADNIQQLSERIYEFSGVQYVGASLLQSELSAVVGDIYQDGQFMPQLQPTRDPEDLQADIVTATQQRLDDFARTRNYDGILSLCTYATSTVQKFQAEGQYGVTARDATWAKLYEMLAEVQAGTRPMPNGYADVEPELPVLEWP